jgi:hypothetical protein
MKLRAISQQCNAAIVASSSSSSAVFVNFVY